MSTPSRPRNLTIVTSPRSSPARSTSYITSPRNDEPRYFPHTIDLLRGHPSTTLLPTAELYSAASIALHTPALLPSDSNASSRHPLHYGPDAGNLNFRTELGCWLAENYALPAPVPPPRLCLTSGASYALLHALTLFTHPAHTKQAFIISPTYFLATRIFQDAGFGGKMMAIDSTHTSLDFAALETALAEFDAVQTPPPEPRPSHVYSYILYGVPTYSNPTGETLDLETRHRLLSLARAHNILLLTDDVYDLLGSPLDTTSHLPTGQLLPRLVTLDALTATTDTGNTLSNCSFSKLLGPGLRCGWVESATPALATRLAESGANHSGGAPSHFVSTMLLPLLLPLSRTHQERKIDSIVRRLREVYAAHHTAAREAVARYLPADTRVWGGMGGFFLWVEIKGVDLGEVVKRAREEGVLVMRGEMCDLPGRGRWKREVRLSVSYCALEEIVEGVQRLGRAVETVKKEVRGRKRENSRKRIQDEV